MSAEQYVTTADVRQAAEGNEETVLQRLGITPNRHRNGHIDCPYADHGGKGDWRWDPVKRRAFCTCTSGDSILDVAMKCEGVDFEGAKIFVAEALGRADLVKAKGDGKDAERDPDNRFLKSTTAGLFAVKGRFRDDALVAIYLGSRLGIADCDVLMPSTPVRGITHHHHYKGKGRDGKPKSVAVTPCAVFMQTDCERRKHDRIVPQPGGTRIFLDRLGPADPFSLMERPRWLAFPPAPRGLRPLSKRPGAPPPRRLPSRTPVSPARA